MKIKEIYIKGKNILEKSTISEFDLKVRLLICYLLNIKKEELILKLDEEMSSEKEQEFFDNIDKLKEGMPIQYILHNQEFMKLNFYVDENVLIPQPDTEILVEEVLKLIKNDNKILDLCTGSGAIAVSIGKYVPNTKVYASDISKSALNVAKKNAENNGVLVDFIQSDLFENINENEFDLIVSNPPYIENSVIDGLSVEVKHEPIIALAGGDDGLDFYRKIAEDAHKYLKPNGYLCLEIGYNQKQSVTEILLKNGYRLITCIKDLAQNDRVILAQK